MTTTHDEFISTHAVNGVLSPLHAAQLLELGLEGDTGNKPEPSDVPVVAAATVQGDPGVQVVNKDEPNGAQTPATGEPDPAKTVILAKDGVHTIDYQKLVDAREGEKHWKAQAEASAAELETLRAQAQQRADAGQAPTTTDNAVAAAAAAIDQGVDPAIFGDFSEQALAAGIQKLVVARVEAQVSAALARIDEKLQPIEVQQTVDATRAHYQAIYAKHPDAASIAESKELADWIATQPSFARAGYETALTKGKAADVIELFDAFKKSTPGMAPAPAPAPAIGDVKAAAKQAIANAPAQVPSSLSDIPGGRGAAGTRDEAMAQMGGRDLLGAMEDMTPEQIEAYLNRSL